MSGRVVAALQPGASPGPYQIDAPLGAGGMGEGYKARDARLERSVAIEVLPADVACDPQERERFEREARVRCRVRSSAHLHAARHRLARRFQLPGSEVVFQNRKHLLRS